MNYIENKEKDLFEALNKFQKEIVHCHIQKDLNGKPLYNEDEFNKKISKLRKEIIGL